MSWHHEVELYGFSPVPRSVVDLQVRAIEDTVGGREALEDRLDYLGLEEEGLEELVARQLQVVTFVEERLGPITGVVNCAGIAADRHVLDTPPELFRKILDVNVIGTFIVGKAAAMRMKERGRGAIVNIASISGLRGSKGRSAYGASKGAVVTLTAFTRPLRRVTFRPRSVCSTLIPASSSFSQKAASSSIRPPRHSTVPPQIAGASM